MVLRGHRRVIDGWDGVLHVIPATHRGTSQSERVCGTTILSGLHIAGAISHGGGIPSGKERCTIQFSNTVNIDRSVGDVYDYLVDLEHTPEWNWAIAETTKISEGPVDVGTRYRQRRTVPSESTEELEITRLEENRLIEVRGTLARFDARLTYRLDTDGAGTRVVNDVDLDPPRGLGIVQRLVVGRISRSVASNLADLKTRLETG